MKSLIARRPVDRKCPPAGWTRAATGTQVRQERYDVALPDGEQPPVVSERPRVQALPQPAPVEARRSPGRHRARVGAPGKLERALPAHLCGELRLEIAEPREGL